MRRLLDTIAWIGVWIIYAISWFVIVGAALVYRLKDPAFLAMLLYIGAVVMFVFWMVFGFPPHWEAI